MLNYIDDNNYFNKMFKKLNQNTGSNYKHNSTNMNDGYTLWVRFYRLGRHPPDILGEQKHYTS